MKARHFQSPSEPVRLIARDGRAPIRRAMTGALRHLGDLMPRDYAIKVAQAGLWFRLKELVAWGHFAEVMKDPFGKIADVHATAAALGVRKINGLASRTGRRIRFRKDIGDRYNWDRFDAGTIARLREYQDSLIQELSTQARDTIDNIIIAGARQGLGPDRIVDDIRAMIGLTPAQAQAVMNYRRALEDLDPAALQRQLRNADYDAAVQDAIDSGEFLPSDQIDRLTADYLENYLTYRAETIAQTESTRAANLGLHDAYQQAIDRGALPRDAITRNWQIALDERTCPICRSIPDLNPDGVAVGEQFQSQAGPVDDPPIHPNCRCSVQYVTDLDQVPEQ